MSSEEKSKRGDALGQAVEAFEARFERVDDHYMHTGESRTVEGVRFRKVYPGSADQNAPVSFSDRYAECAEAWLADMIAAVEAYPTAKILFWRVRPHYITLPSGGITIESSFAVWYSSDISEETIQRWAEADLKRAQEADAADAAAAAAPEAEKPPAKKGKKKAATTEDPAP